jgi:hypothetical protein
MRKRERVALRFALTPSSAFARATADIRHSSLAFRRATADAFCLLLFIP